MHPALNTAKKYARYTATGLLVTGMVLFTGFMSFTGMLVLNSSIYLAITAFMLAGGVEGEIYAQNIHSSFLKLFSGKYWEKAVLEKVLDQLIEKAPSDCTFFKDYQALRDYVHKLKHHHHLDKETRKKLQEKEAELAAMKQIFHRYISGSKVTEEEKSFHEQFNDALLKLLSEKDYPLELTKDLDPLKPHKNHPKIIAFTKATINKEIRKKTWLSRFSAILTLGAGVSCALVGLEVAQSSIAALAVHFGITLSATALTACVFGLAILGAVGYTMLIYNTITDMIKNETLQNWFTKTKIFFQVKKDQDGKPLESRSLYLLRTFCGAFGVGIIVGLGVFTTVATAGTWWHAAKAGAKIIPTISRYANELRTTVVSIMGLTTLMFTVVNSLKSVDELIKISARKSAAYLKLTFNKYRQSENFIQLINPARLVINLITVPFKIVTFVGHLFSMGLMADKLDNVPPLATALLAMTNELLTDIHYFLPPQQKTFDIHITSLEGIKGLKDVLVIIQGKCPELLFIDSQGKSHSILNDLDLSQTLTDSYKSITDNKTPGSIKSLINDNEWTGLNKRILDKVNSKTEAPHDHDHQHIDLVGRFLKATLLPVYLIAAAWDYLFSGYGSSKPLSFRAAYHKLTHGIHHEVTPQEPVLSEKWQSYNQKRISEALQLQSSNAKMSVSMKQANEEAPTGNQIRIPNKTVTESEPTPTSQTLKAALWQPDSPQSRSSNSTPITPNLSQSTPV